MSTPTPPSEPIIPPGTLSYAQIRQLFEADEAAKQKVRDELQGAVATARGWFTDGFLEALAAALAGVPPPGFEKILDAFTGNSGAGLPAITSALTDQQSKVQELYDERGRAHVYSRENLAYRGFQQHNQRMRIPFTEQVGPLVGVTIDPAGGLVLRTAGSWQIQAKTGVSGTMAAGANWARMWIEAYRADGSKLAESFATSVPGADQGTTSDVMALVINPEEAAAGVTVRVYADAGRWRYILGGPGYTYLLAQKQSSTRVQSTTDPGDPGVWEEQP